jgi:hypothetical protein
MGRFPRHPMARVWLMWCNFPHLWQKFTAIGNTLQDKGLSMAERFAILP